MSKSSKALREQTTKLNIRIFNEDIEAAKEFDYLMPGMSYHSVLREWVKMGRKQYQADKALNKPAELPRRPVFK